MNKESISYIKTFFITVLLITIVISAIVVMTKKHAENPPSQFEIESVKTTKIITAIDEYQFKEKFNKNNYRINLRLGLIYESLGKFDEAESEYQKAINKAPSKQLEPTLFLIELYIKENKLDNAQKLIDQIKESPKKSIIKAKSSKYKKLADAYLKNGQYQQAITQYKNSLYYLRKIRASNKSIEENLAKSYIGISNDYLKKSEYQKAVDVLKEGLDDVDSGIIKNHLALLYSETEPQTSLKWFESALYNTPSFINYDEYKNVLNALVKDAENEKNAEKTKAYNDKLSRLNKFIENSIINEGDFDIIDVKASFKKYPIINDCCLNLSFRVKNNSKNTVHVLLSEIKIYNDTRLIKTIKQRIISPSSPIGEGKLTKPVNIKVNYLCSPNNENLNIKIYIKKIPKIKSTLLAEIILQDK